MAKKIKAPPATPGIISNMASGGAKTAGGLAAAGIGFTAVGGALYYGDELIFNGGLTEAGEAIFEKFATMGAEAGAQVQANAISESLYANLRELGQVFSGISAAMGLQQDIGIGLQNFSLAMMGDQQTTHDVYGRPVAPLTFTNTTDDILIPLKDAVVDTPTSDETAADAAADSEAPEGDAPADEEITQTSSVDPSVPLVSQISALSDKVLVLAGNNGNVESPCGELRQKWAQVTDPMQIGAFKSAVPAAGPALEQCDIGAPTNG